MTDSWTVEDIPDCSAKTAVVTSPVAVYRSMRRAQFHGVGDEATVGVAASVTGGSNVGAACLRARGIDPLVADSDRFARGDIQ